MCFISLPRERALSTSALSLSRDKIHSKGPHPISVLPRAKAKKQLLETHFHQQSTASTTTGGLQKRVEPEEGIDERGITGGRKE